MLDASATKWSTSSAVAGAGALLAVLLVALLDAFACGLPPVDEHAERTIPRTNMPAMAVPACRPTHDRFTVILSSDSHGRITSRMACYPYGAGANSALLHAPRRP